MRIDWDWWNISVFCVIPLLSVVTIFFVKRKLLWIAPLISTFLSIAISVIAMPSIISYSEHRAMFFGISIPIHLVITIALTAIAYFVAFILKRKHSR